MNLKIRSGPVCDTKSFSQRRARSVTPGLYVKKNSRMNSINWETFFKNENGKIPYNTPALPTNSEKVEFTAQLKILKNQFNKTKNEWNIIESNLNKTKNEVLKVENTEKTALAKIKSMKDKEELLIKKLEKIKKDFKFSLVDYNSYFYVKQRMYITGIFLEIKLNELRGLIHFSNERLKEEERNMIKTIDINDKTLENFKSLKFHYESDDKRRNLITKQLDKDLGGKQDQNWKRDEMKKRRLEIVEKVANDDKNQRNNLLREGLLLHRLWSRFLNNKKQKETQKFSYIDKAYASIRSLTGMSNIHEVVQKILTRENSYNSLMNMIIESKKICENYQQRNLDLEDDMTAIIVREEVENPSIHQNLQKKAIAKLMKAISRDKEKLFKLRAARSFVFVWIKNILKKIRTNNDSINSQSIAIMFSALQEFIKSKAKTYSPITEKIDYEVATLYSQQTKEQFMFKSEKKYVDSTENLKITDLVYSEDDLTIEKVQKPQPSAYYHHYTRKNDNIESMSPVDRNGRKKPIKKL